MKNNCEGEKITHITTVPDWLRFVKVQEFTERMLH